MSEDSNLEATNQDELMALEDLKDEREVFKEALRDSCSRLNEINCVKQVDEDLVSEIKALQIVIEPSLIEIKDLDMKIQAEIRKLKLRDALVEEIKQSRSYAAKVQVALNKALELEKKDTKKDNVAGIGGHLGLKEI